MLETKMLDLVSLSEAEWRSLRTAVEYALHHDDHEPAPLVYEHFPEGLPAPDVWKNLTTGVRSMRAALDAKMMEGQTLSRRDYMRLYMQKRRAKQVE